MRFLRRIFGDRQGLRPAHVPDGWELHRLEPPTLDKALRDFRVELAPSGSFDIYLARLMLNSGEKRRVGDEEITELPRYKDLRRSAIVGMLREYLHNALAAKIERYLADAYVRIRDVGDPNHIAAEADAAVEITTPADAKFDANALAKFADGTDHAADDGHDGGENRDDKR